MKLLLLVAGLCMASLLVAQNAAPFDYYILSLSWAPEFCAQPDQAAANPLECGPGKGFVVHGLWPEADRGRSPESCGPSKSVPRGIVNEILRSMPSPALIQHEWATHGTCTGLSQGDYFTKVMLARAAVQIPVQISSLGQGTMENPGELEAQFAATNPQFPSGAVRIACREGELTEVRICFDKNLKARACTASAGECTSLKINIRSPR
jgi:ribonuclease T2